MKIKKINKHLFIVDDNDEQVYSPPNFIRLNSRHNLQSLIDDLEAGRPYIQAVTAWETHMRPIKQRKNKENE